MTAAGNEGPRLYNHSDFVRVFVIVVYFLVVAILAVHTFTSMNTEASYILARLLPHLFYIPLVLTALWYPRQRLAHITIFCIIFLGLISAFLLNGWSMDAVFTLFTSFIYLWVFIAILAIPKVRLGGMDGGDERSDAGTAVSSAPSPVPGEESLPGVAGHLPGDAAAGDIVFPSTQIVPLIESFRLGDQLISRNTSSALKAIGSPAVPYIVAGMNSDSIAIRENCARLLGEIHDTDSIPLLVDAMDDRSRRVHNAATQALAKMGRPAVQPLIDGLGNSKWKVRAGSVVALRIIGLHDAMPSLTGMLDDESHHVRKEVVKSLARLGREEVLDSLIYMLSDESRGVRLAAVGGLGRSGNSEAIDALKGVLADEKDAEVRVRAVHSLELIGTAAAFEAMRTCLDDPDPEVSASARDILKENFRI